MFGLFYIVFAKNDSGKLEAIKADKIYQMKFKNGEIKINRSICWDWWYPSWL